jgi:hypothetical protein
MRLSPHRDFHLQGLAQVRATEPGNDSAGLDLDAAFPPTFP